MRNTIEELVRLTGHCRTTEERLAILEPYLEDAAEQMAGQELAETHAAPAVFRTDTTTRRWRSRTTAHGWQFETAQSSAV